MEENNTTTDANPSQKSGFNPLMLVGLVVVVLGAGLFFAKSKKSTDTMTVVEPSTGPATTTTTDESAVNIAVEAGSFYYKPIEIRVKVGQKVKITLTAVDMMHDFNIDELGVKVPVTKSGTTNTAEFTAFKTGTFEYYCSVGQHRARGQVGKLIVE